MGLTPHALAAVAAAATLFVGACGGTEPGSSGEAGPEQAAATAAWRAVPPGPLSPRDSALALWTGKEVLLIGGSDGPPCPPSAECAIPTTAPLADGAAYDPATETWRRIADSPVPFDWAEGVVIGQTAYIWIPGNEYRPGAARAFLAYSLDEDRWEELPPPSTDPAQWYEIAPAGDRIVAFGGSDEVERPSDVLFDPETRAWSELPPDPLTPSFDRVMAWSGDELVLFDHELVPNPGAEEPSITRAAALDLDTGAWRRLPDSEILASGPWVTAGDRLVNPTLGGADGGEVGNWGKTYAYGGILDPETGEWSALPDTPFEQDDYSTFSAGVLAEDGGHYFGDQGWILDISTGTWIEIPPLEAEQQGLVTARSVIGAGDDLFVFGGARWSDQSALEGELLADAWIWSPRGLAVIQCADARRGRTDLELLTIGRIGVDLYPEQSNVPIARVQTFAKSIGGTATNVAVAAARLGRRAAVATRVGDDPFGDYVRLALEDEFGVDTRFVGDRSGAPDPDRVLRARSARGSAAHLLPRAEGARHEPRALGSRPRHRPERADSLGCGIVLLGRADPLHRARGARGPAGGASTRSSISTGARCSGPPRRRAAVRSARRSTM